MHQEAILELCIELTDRGPVVRLSGARLELDATETLALKAQRIEFEAAEEAAIHSDGNLTLTSGLDTRTVAEGDGARPRYLHLAQLKRRARCLDRHESEWTWCSKTHRIATLQSIRQHRVPRRHPTLPRRSRSSGRVR